MGKDIETVERLIDAPAKAIFDLLADPSRHHDIDGSGTVVASTEPSTRLKLGSTFGMSMKMGFGYSMANRVIEFEENKRIAWQTRPPNALMGRLVGGRIWRYELAEVDGGTLVKESWDISQERVKLAVEPMRAATKKAMAATLERIAEVVGRS